MRSVSNRWLRLATLPLVVAGAVFALGLSGFLATFQSPDYTRPLLPLPDVAWALDRAQVDPAAGWSQTVEPPTTTAPLETAAAVVEPTITPDKQSTAVVSAASAGPAGELPAPPTPQATPSANNATPTVYPDAPAKGGSTQPWAAAAAPVAGTSEADVEPKGTPSATPPAIATPVVSASPTVTAAAAEAPGDDDGKDKKDKKNDRADQSASHGRDR